ncbi:hypothetical protein [Streptomyces indicus]|uniref:Tail assembly chaperone n=1 Tax=Streptomyces indicus TaxID=417292 RepID=A0A1G9IRA4_9ACTN|nr:hypothetical protein [Streptomyces indicus]SDL27672.1 hypothetical protein SAMN05421806_12520 [Streptomyces indicus]
MPATKKQIEAASAQEAEAAEQEYVTVPLAGHDGVTKDVRCVPSGRWRASALRALNTGDIDGFMETVLHPDDFELFQELDPDMDGFGKFVADAGRISGESVGKSSGPTRSSRSTRKR